MHLPGDIAKAIDTITNDSMHLPGDIAKATLDRKYWNTIAKYDDANFDKYEWLKFTCRATYCQGNYWFECRASALNKAVPPPERSGAPAPRMHTYLEAGSPTHMAPMGWAPLKATQYLPKYGVNAIQTPATKTLASFWGLGWPCGLRRSTRPATTILWYCWLRLTSILRWVWNRLGDFAVHVHCHSEFIHPCMTCHNHVKSVQQDNESVDWNFFSLRRKLPWHYPGTTQESANSLVAKSAEHYRFVMLRWYDLPKP